MDVGSENRGDEPQQAPEKETAIGSAGLFGDLRHEKPKQSQQSSVDPQPVQGPYAPTQQAAFDQTAANTSRLNRPPTHDATEMQESSQRQRFDHSLANQPMVAGAQSSVQPQSHHAGPTISQKTFAAGAAGQQQPLQSPNTVSEQQATTHALYDEQAEQQQPQQQEDITTDLDQAPPMMEAQLAEEQDLVPDVGSANRIPRLQRLRKAIDRLTYEYVFACRSSMRPIRRLAATRQYTPAPPPPILLPQIACGVQTTRG